MMPISKFLCLNCGKEFDKILANTDPPVTCGACRSTNVKRVFEPVDFHKEKSSTTIPAGALSGGSCRSGFS